MLRWDVCEGKAYFPHVLILGFGTKVFPAGDLIAHPSSTRYPNLRGTELSNHPLE